MSGFLIIALLMTVIAVVCIFVPYRRRHNDVAAPADRLNLDVLRDQMKELESDYAAGLIGKKELEEARNELNRRTLEETEANLAAQPVPEQAQVSTMPRSQKIIWGVASFLAIFAVGALFYWVIGTPTAFTAKATQRLEQQNPHASVNPQDMEAMLQQYAKKMEADPENSEGWMVLARSYAELGKYQQAAAAYEHVLQRHPDDADVLADYADLLGAMQNGELEGRPMQMVERALKADPHHWKALALAGTHAFNHADYGKAVEYWTRLKASLPTDSEMATAIDSGIKEAQSRISQKK